MAQSSRYSSRYRTPSPLFATPTATSLPRLLAAWERLRELDTEGYRTSSATPNWSTWLVEIKWLDRVTHRAPGRGTTCSPFTTQAAAMAFSPGDGEPYVPQLADGQPLPFLFSQLANGALRASNPVHQKTMQKYGVTAADNEWPRPVIFFNMGYAVELEQLRRGDAVHIDWTSGGGHAVFCWDVHLNERGEVDAFQYVSSNGSIAGGGSGGGVSVGGTSKGAGGFVKRLSADPPSYRAEKVPLFRDAPGYVQEGAWVTWDPAVAERGLHGLRGGISRRVTLAKRVKAARFHGVDPSTVPLYAMGQDVAIPLPAAVPAATPAVVTPVAIVAAPVAAPVADAVAAPPAPGVPAESDAVDASTDASDDPEPVAAGPEASPVVRAEETEAAPASAPGPSSEEKTRKLQRWLKLLSGIGWIDTDPGEIDGKFGRKTTAAVIAFQRAYELNPDGKVGPLTSAKLEKVFRSALDSPEARRLLPGDADLSGLSFAERDDWDAGARLYFRHGAARAGDAVELILRGDRLPQDRALRIVLREADTLAPLPGALDYAVRAEGMRAAVRVTLPARAAGMRVVAAVAATGLFTAAPLQVVAAIPSG